MANHSPLPTLRGPSWRITTPRGFLLWSARTGLRYFVTGNPIDGKLRDNASWLHDATADHRGGPVPKLSRARWRRVARRWTLVGAPGSLLSLHAASVPVEALGFHPGWTTVPWGALAGGYAVALPTVAGMVAYPRARTYLATRELRREVIHPATRVACQILGQRWDRRLASRMLELPAGFNEPSEDDDAQPAATLYVPPVPLDPGTKRRIVANVGARLGMPDASGEWQEFGGRAWVRISGADVPPKRLDMGAAIKLEDGGSSSLRTAIESADRDHPVIGVASGGRVVRADYLDASPNVAVSGATGSGKSTLFRLLLAQRLRAGTGLVVLDLKGISHPWVYKLPKTRALYFHHIEQIHDAAVAVGAELFARREAAVQAVKAGNPAPEFRPVDVLVEEANSLIVDLQAYWTNRRKEIQRENKEALELDDAADVTEPPVRSPAVDALGFLIQMGRELIMFPHYAGQRLDAQVFGGQGGARRASFQQRALGRWGRPEWRMLCPDIPYRVCPSGPTGIWAWVAGSHVDMVRVPDMSNDQAASMVLDSPDPGTPVLSTLSTASVSGRTIPGEVVQVDRLAAVRGQRVSIRDAADTVGLSVEALRSARKQDARFPEPVEIGGSGRADLFDMADLIEWREARDGALVKVG